MLLGSIIMVNSYL